VGWKGLQYSPSGILFIESCSAHCSLVTLTSTCSIHLKTNVYCLFDVTRLISFLIRGRCHRSSSSYCSRSSSRPPRPRGHPYLASRPSPGADAVAGADLRGGVHQPHREWRAAAAGRPLLRLATYLGRESADGFDCHLWTRVESVLYYEDVAIGLPVRAGTSRMVGAICNSNFCRWF
jgi:hypothetical protein